MRKIKLKERLPKDVQIGKDGTQFSKSFWFDFKEQVLHHYSELISAWAHLMR